MAKPAARKKRNTVGGGAAWRKLGISLVFLAVAGGLAYGVSLLVADPRLALGEVSVTGAERTGSTLVLSAAALPAGRDIWLLDTGAAERRIDELPWVAGASIRRAWPNQVSIAVVERTPAARLTLAPGTPGSGVALLDADARVLDVDTNNPKDAGLPILTVLPLPPEADAVGSQLHEPHILDALAAASRLAALGVHVVEVQIDSARGITAVTASNLHVVFGDLDELERKVALFTAIEKRLARPDDVAYVDVRSTNAPTVQYR